MQTTTEKQIKERPILFSGEMVRAILDGRKTQTRRVVRFHKDWDGETVFRHSFKYQKLDGTVWRIPSRFHVSDRLWVRETWGYEFGCGYLYRASHGHMTPGDNRWRPSIHMPRAASRIILQVIDVKIERLHDITEDDAVKEGVDYNPLQSHPYWHYGFEGCWGEFNAVGSFASLWKLINGNESWEQNPWVWVIEFKRI